MKKLFLNLFFIIILSGCNSFYQGSNVHGADEFVLDSYKIKEGKFSILEMQGHEHIELTSSYFQVEKDVIQNGDVLKIELFHPTRSDLVNTIKSISSNFGFLVKNDVIILPDIGSIDVHGLTLEDASRSIKETYQKEMKDIEVFLAYKDRKTQKVLLAGLVGASSIILEGKMRLFDILSKAKISPDANLYKSYLIRDDKFVAVDFNKLLNQGDMSQNIIMKGGDKIYIADASSAKLMVMGEVKREGVINLLHGSLSLREALAQAGGIPFSGDRRHIQVIRGSLVQPKIYTLSWKHIINLPNSSLLLMPGDIVYVASKPISEWNRFISQILPTFGILDSAMQGFKNFGILVQ